MKIISETTLFPRQNLETLAVVIKAVSDDIQRYLADVPHQRDTPVTATLYPIIFLVGHFECGIFRCCTFPQPNANDDLEPLFDTPGDVRVERR